MLTYPKLVEFHHSHQKQYSLPSLCSDLQRLPGKIPPTGVGVGVEVKQQKCLTILEADNP